MYLAPTERALGYLELVVVNYDLIVTQLRRRPSPIGQSHVVKGYLTDPTERSPKALSVGAMYMIMPNYSV